VCVCVVCVCVCVRVFVCVCVCVCVAGVVWFHQKNVQSIGNGMCVRVCVVCDMHIRGNVCTWFNHISKHGRVGSILSSKSGRA
jgi:hypothetical protein